MVSNYLVVEKYLDLGQSISDTEQRTVVIADSDINGISRDYGVVCWAINSHS
jgi:hypothetical protein